MKQGVALCSNHIKITVCPCLSPFAHGDNAAPFYMITSGDLIRLIWVNPKWSFNDTGSIIANGAFLMGSGDRVKIKQFPGNHRKYNKRRCKSY